jgi:S-formylglutathione hydrolase FrmB
MMRMTEARVFQKRAWSRKEFLPMAHPIRIRLFLSLALAFVLPCSMALAQSQIVDVTIHSTGLEHNLLGDSADQPVSIYLPDAYAQEPERRFPVLYFLHGYGGEPNTHANAERLRGAMDKGIAAGTVKPMIVVLPNGSNKYHGSFYANSSTTGNWDDFIVKDVVGYVDNHYRTLAFAERRGLAGHSMGGFGALTLGFRHPDVFSSIYALSPCCTDLVGDMGPSRPEWVGAAGLKSPDEVPAALKNGRFLVAAFSAMSAALAPDPDKKTFGDLPFVVANGEMRTDPVAYSRIAENMPANMVVPLLPKIAQLKGIFIDFGAQDNFSHIVIGAEETAERLTQAGIPNTLEVYQGNHSNHVEQRIIDRLLPWMTAQIAQ